MNGQKIVLRNQPYNRRISMTSAPRLVVITGLPGSGKSSTAKWLASLLFVTWISRFITRPFRKSEIDGTENIRISDEEFLRRKKAGKLFHPTETEIPPWGSHYRGYRPMHRWVPLSGTDIMLVVTGPRAALEIYDLWLGEEPLIFFLTAPRDVLVNRILERGDPWGTSRHPQKIREYEGMNGGAGIELDFKRRGIPVVNTHEVDPEAVARRILLRLGRHPVAPRIVGHHSSP